MKFVLALAAALGLSAVAGATPQQFVVVQQRQAVVVQQRQFVVVPQRQAVVVQRVVAAPAAVQVNVNERRGLFNRDRGSVVVNNGAQRVVIRR